VDGERFYSGTSFVGDHPKYLFGVPAEPPSSINETVMSFIREELHLDGTPVNVPCAAEPDAKRLDCYANVEREILRRGGGRRYGWLIWQHTDAMIEGEFHCMWITPDGTLLDVTPHDGEPNVLFVPDPGRRYLGQNIPNVRRFLHDDEYSRHVKERIAQQDELERNPPPNVIIRRPPAVQVAPIGRNDHCPCGSGRKYKKCCMLLND
jgi:hypothetical protein